MDGAARAGTPGGAGGAWVRGGDNGTWDAGKTWCRGGAFPCNVAASVHTTAIQAFPWDVLEKEHCWNSLPPDMEYLHPLKHGQAGNISQHLGNAVQVYTEYKKNTWVPHGAGPAQEKLLTPEVLHKNLQISIQCVNLLELPLKRTGIESFCISRKTIQFSMCLVLAHDTSSFRLTIQHYGRWMKDVPPIMKLEPYQKSGYLCFKI